MKTLISIGAGSFIGGVFRYLLTQIIETKSTSILPLGTLTVNVIGSLLIGIVIGLIDRGSLSHEWRFFLVTGLLGGFTTFSAFSSEMMNLIRAGEILFATTYVVVSILFSLSATYIGFAISKSF